MSSGSNPLMRASRSASKPGAHLIPPAIILLAAVVAYHGSLGVPFFFDDLVAITNNPTIRNLWRIWDVLSPPNDGGGAMGRPIVNLSLALNYALSGTDVRDYHAFNLLIHALCALTLFGLVRRTLVQPALNARFGAAASSISFIVALGWTVHPLQSESVACVIQRTELLVGIFYLLTLYCFVRSAGEPRSRHWPPLAIVSCALGMASKEVMVSAPLIVLLYDRTFIAGTFRAAWQQRRGLYIGLAATWVILGTLLAHIGGARGEGAGFGLGVSWWAYALKQCEAIIGYFKLSLWPHPLVIDYGTEVIADPFKVIPEALVILLLIAGMIVALRSRPSLGFLMAWVFAILAPSSSVVPLVSQTMAEHRMYLPLAAPIALGVASAYRLAGTRVVTIAVPVALAWCLATVARVRTMQDEVGLWTDTVAKVPSNPRAHGSLGYALSNRGQPGEALVHFQKALELDPLSVATEMNIGNVYFRLRDFTAAAAHYRRAVELDPKFASGYNNLGATLIELREFDDALASFRTALELEPDHAGALQNAGRALLALNRFTEAVEHYEKLQQLRPVSADAQYNFGLALARAGDLERAAKHFGEALRLRPTAAAYLSYARFLANAGRTKEAITNLEIVLQLEPDTAEARLELERLRGQR